MLPYGALDLELDAVDDVAREMHRVALSARPLIGGKPENQHEIRSRRRAVTDCRWALCLIL